MIGQLRERITIQTLASTADTGGGISASFSDSETIHARIKPTNGKEVYAQGKVQDRVTHEILIRHNTSVTPKTRIKYGTRFFNVRAVLNIDERDRYMKVLAEEGAPS